jgi:hypothetical protein
MGVDAAITGRWWRRRIDHDFDDRIGHVRRFQAPEPFDARVQTYGFRPGGTRGTNLRNDHVIGQAHLDHIDDVFVREPLP